MYELTQVREIINGVFKGYKELKFTHHREFDVWVLVNKENDLVCFKDNIEVRVFDFHYEIKKVVKSKTWRLKTFFVPSQRVNKCWAFWSLEQRKRLISEQVPITCLYRKKEGKKREFFFFIESNGMMLINDFFHEITSILPNKAILHHKNLPRKLKKLGYNITNYEIYFGQFDDL
ncbi:MULTISPECIES: hypothetical protein [Bacillus]|uniref:hypothetical protein n=1 Tax=Bacillus TaxID=1386 RepID=UPI0008FDF0C1|nr:MULTISPECIES: hypothetical protein [Bacillus]OJE32407.1 hypothetical protein BAQ44_22205 [Bacillus mobilis]HDR7243164.1 hypothetical protein [Bacillus mobilis]HDR7244989.1 hypothetical protein [Bacillus mobilis]